VKVLKEGAPYLSAILFALPLAYSISWAVNKFWPGSRWIVFAAVVLFWVNGVIQVIFRNLRSGEKVPNAVFADPKNWDPAELPAEFQSLTRGMTLDEVFSLAGPCTRVTETGVACYDLPSGGFLEVFPERAFDNSSRIKAIQLYRTEATE
jgi:hypothetical protein